MEVVHTGVPSWVLRDGWHGIFVNTPHLRVPRSFLYCLKSTMSYKIPRFHLKILSDFLREEMQGLIIIYVGARIFNGLTSVSSDIQGHLIWESSTRAWSKDVCRRRRVIKILFCSKMVGLTRTTILRLRTPGVLINVLVTIYRPLRYLHVSVSEDVVTHFHT